MFRKQLPSYPFVSAALMEVHYRRRCSLFARTLRRFYCDLENRNQILAHRGGQRLDEVKFSRQPARNLSRSSGEERPAESRGGQNLQKAAPGNRSFGVLLRVLRVEASHPPLCLRWLVGFFRQPRFHFDVAFGNDKPGISPVRDPDLHLPGNLVFQRSILLKHSLIKPWCHAGKRWKSTFFRIGGFSLPVTLLGGIQ